MVYEQCWNESCTICRKMGWECPVVIEGDGEIIDYEPDYSECVWKQKFYEIMTK